MARYTNPVLLLLAAFTLSGCAATQLAIESPVVSLKRVDVAEVGFSRQTFVLSFDVINPNPFSLPINHVSYGVKLDKQRFASGESVASFSIPANSDGEFAISVDLDLLRTAPQLLYIVRDSAVHDVAYELSGKFGVDIPFVDSVPFQYNGDIRLQAGLVTRATNHSGDKTP